MKMAFFAYLKHFLFWHLFQSRKIFPHWDKLSAYEKKIDTIKTKSDCRCMRWHCGIPGMGYRLGQNIIRRTFGTRCNPHGRNGLSYFMGGHA